MLFQTQVTFMFRGFSTSAANFYPLTNHKLYPKVDWEKVEGGSYAVVDPVNPGVILYLSEQDYIIMIRVAITSNRTLKVLAEAGTSKPSSDPSDPTTSQNSPPSSSSKDKALDASWLSTFVFGRRTSTGARGRKRARFIFSSPLLPFSVRVNGNQIIRGLYDGILMIKLHDRNIVEWFTSWHKRLYWWSRGSQLATVHRVEANSFGLRLRKLFRNNGINHIIARFKIMLFVVNAYLGGRRLKTTNDLGFRIRLSSGLPTLIPRMVRDGIRHGNRHYIHIWTSLLFSYKGILGTWVEPDLTKSAITTPHPVISEEDTQDFRDFALMLWENLRSQFSIRKPDLTIKVPFFSTKAGPNHPITILGAGIDAYLWSALDKLQSPGKPEDSALSDHDMEAKVRNEHIAATAGVKRNYIREWLTLTGQTDLLKQFRITAKAFALQHNVLEVITAANTITVYENVTRKPGFEPGEDHSNYKTPGLLETFRRKLDTWIPNWVASIMGHNNTLLRFKTPTLSRLHNLYEAAGKVRTIAIVDYWTNFVLKPLHDWMFSILRNLPQDATFDQEGRVSEFAQRGYTTVYSYDLKSATDLIPLQLYKIFFKEMLPKGILDLWIDLLVNRDFLVPSSTRKEYPDHPRRIRYLTGQPMGALTSWASMALVHHALVLYAAYMAGVIDASNILSFKDYLVLGDDIVIANRAVAEEYIRLMKIWHIPVGLAKSHISENGMFNFANQTLVGTTNVSPISLREDLNANSLPARAELVMRMARRGWMDLSSRTWLITVLRKFFDEKVWSTAIAPMVQRRETHPIIKWILAVLLTPGATRFGFTGIVNINLDTFLAAQLQISRLWSTRVSNLYQLIDRDRSDALLIAILGKWVKRLYGSFLENRNRFLGMEKWITSITSVELEWLLRLVFEQARKSAFERWTGSHRMFLKELQISTMLTAIKSRELFSIAVGVPWDDIVSKVATAEATLPLVPEFTQASLEVISPGSDGVAGAHALYRQQLLSFMRVTDLLGMVDDLSLSGTPGFEKPGNTSQSSTPTL